MVFEKVSHCVVWCLEKVKEKEMAKRQKKGVADMTQIGWRLVGGVYIEYIIKVRESRGVRLAPHSKY